QTDQALYASADHLRVFDDVQDFANQQAVHAANALRVVYGAVSRRAGQSPPPLRVSALVRAPDSCPGCQVAAVTPPPREPHPTSALPLRRLRRQPLTRRKSVRPRAGSAPPPIEPAAAPAATSERSSAGSPRPCRRPRC
ncbi:MAG: hypothetical protein ACXVBO_10455, partial [Isosphaeraceae bacterium]